MLTHLYKILSVQIYLNKDQVSTKMYTELRKVHIFSWSGKDIQMNILVNNVCHFSVITVSVTDTELSWY